MHCAGDALPCYVPSLQVSVARGPSPLHFPGEVQSSEAHHLNDWHVNGRNGPGLTTSDGYFFDVGLPVCLNLRGMHAWAKLGAQLKGVCLHASISIHSSA